MSRRRRQVFDSRKPAKVEGPHSIDDFDDMLSTIRPDVTIGDLRTTPLDIFEATIGRRLQAGTMRPRVRRARVVPPEVLEFARRLQAGETPEEAGEAIRAARGDA